MKNFDVDERVVSELLTLAKRAGIPEDSIRRKGILSNKIQVEDEYANQFGRLIEKASKRIELLEGKEKREGVEKKAEEEQPEDKE